jgi:uncharacterized cupin superfamily protein
MSDPITSPAAVDVVVNVADVVEIDHTQGAWGGSYKPLTPAIAAVGGARLGVSMSRLTKGHTTCPFHHHLREDEAFFVLSGRGVLRYGDTLRDLVPGDCVACPAGTGLGHQIANPYDEDLVYLAMGVNDPHEVCVYPDTGKVMVRGLGRIGLLHDAEYMAGEPESPKIFDLIARRSDG